MVVGDLNSPSALLPTAYLILVAIGTQRDAAAANVVFVGTTTDWETIRPGREAIGRVKEILHSRGEHGPRERLQ